MSKSRVSRQLLACTALILAWVHPLPAALFLKSDGTAQAQVAQAPAQSSGAATYLDELVDRAKKLLSAKPRDPRVAAGLLNEAAAAGQTEAMVLLAELYRTGDGVAADFNRAKTLIEGAIAAGAGSDGWSALGDLYRNADAGRRDVAMALDAYQKAANLGDRWAMINLAQIISSGGGVPVDFDRARTLLETAIAGGGDAATLAWLNLGDLLRTAGAAQRDPAKAIAAYQEAVRLGNASAMINLGRMYAAGDGGAADFDRARVLFESAIAAGSAKDGWANLGGLYRDADAAHRDAAKAAKAYQKAGEIGDAWSMISLGRLYAAGDGVPADFNRAKTIFESAAANGGDAGRAAWINLAELYRRAAPPRRDMGRAVAAYQKAIDLGDTGAMISLGQMHAGGDGVAADFDKAKALFDKASGSGAARDGSAALGDLYRNADASRRDLPKAVAAYQKAADLGDSGSMVSLGKMLSAGEGVPADFDRAKAILQKAVAAGSAKDGWAALGVLYRTIDPVQAAQAYQKAAELGDPWSMISLAQVLASGSGMPADPDRARALLEKAIDSGGEAATRAWVNLGDLYRNANAVRDSARAATAYQKAVALGNTDAMVSLARMLAAGEGVKVDFEKARVLLENAVAAGAAKDGWAALGGLYRDADSTRRNPAKAAAAYQKAADLGDARSMISLGRMLGAGDGVPADLDRARALFESAAAAGGSAARLAWINLGELYKNDPAKAALAYQKGADLGDAEAMLRLGRMLGSGDGVPADFDRARVLLEKAVAAGSARDGWSALGTLYRDTNPAKAVEAYQKAADLGDPWSMVSLARMLGTGKGVPADYERARVLLESAAALGGSSAQAAWVNLGDLYANDGAAGHDPAKAVAAYQKAIALGNTSAMISLGRMIGAGEGVSVDFDKAKALFENAIAAGAAKDGWSALASLYRRAEGNRRDPVKAVAAYQKAVDLGDTGSMLDLAQMVGAGEGVPADFDRAKALLEKAIAAGSAKDGWSSLGGLYRNAADATHRDLVKSAAAYQKAADLGDPWSMISLGRMLSSGDGLPADFKRAKGLFDGAAAIGGSAAQWAWLNLGDLSRNDKGPFVDPAKAVSAYDKAIELGNVPAMISLARMYGDGDGIAADFAKAIALLDRAVAGGSAEAAMAQGDLYRTDRTHGDAAKALKAYQVAAAYGNADAHLAAAQLMGGNFRQYPSKAPIAQHFKLAAKSLGPAPVAKAMFTLKTEALYAVVQELLIGAGADPGPADGVYRRKTQKAIETFCAARRINSCGDSYVTLALLSGLLADR